MKKYLKLEMRDRDLLFKLDDLYCPVEGRTDTEGWAKVGDSHEEFFELIIMSKSAELYIGTKILSKKEEILEFFL